MPSPRLRILVTEDDATNRLLAGRLLEKSGHSVVLAASGEDALCMLEAEAFDLVVMDVEMPGMDGLETTRKIRERERGTSLRLPIIAATAGGEPGDRERCLAAGMDGYLSKPIRARELLAELARLGIADGDAVADR